MFVSGGKQIKTVTVESLEIVHVSSTGLISKVGSQLKSNIFLINSKKFFINMKLVASDPLFIYVQFYGKQCSFRRLWLYDKT